MGPFALCLRFKKQLSIALVLVLTLVLLHSRDTIQSSFRADRVQVPTATEIGDVAKIPKTNTNVGIEVDSNVDEAFKFRQELAKTLDKLIKEYRPAIEDVNPEWWAKWPTMPPLEVYKEYNYTEVVAASQHFFRDDDALAKFKTQQQALKDAIPTWDMVKKGYSGRGVVISAGAYHLARVWPHVVLMLRDLNCTLPIEVWTKDQDEYDRTKSLVAQIRRDFNVQISIHTLSSYIDHVWMIANIPSIFKVKPLSLLYSSFDEVIMFDADSMPVMDPAVLFDSEEGKTGLIQWPDFWSSSVSSILQDVYGFDHSMIRSCESGQLMLKKSKHFAGLVLANYHNWWGPDFFYKLIYLDSMGAGDKDTFWVGAAAYQGEFHVVERRIELIPVKKIDGTYWREAQSIFNGAMGQFNPLNNSEIFTMHMHAPKVNMQAKELAGQFDLLFFQPNKDDDVVYTHGADWLEKKLWEHLQWIECHSILKKPKTNACSGISARVASM